MAWAIVVGAGVSLVGAYMSSKSNKSSGGGGTSASGGTYDPYGPYRDAAAQKLNGLMNDPSQVQSTPEYAADMQAASRTMAAQGYTGSGNALVASANAGGQAYQQAFNNLAMLSGAGQSPAAAASAADAQSNYQQQASNQMWGQIGGVVGQGINGFSNSGGNIPQVPVDNYSPTLSAPDTSMQVSDISF